MMYNRILLLGLALHWWGCSDVVHVQLIRGDCEDSWLADTFSANAKLRRADGVGVERCVDTHTAPGSLLELERLLAERVVFDEIPTGGDWTIWVEGYSGSDCGGLGQLCGTTSNLQMPPADGRILVVVDCKSPVSGGKSQKIRECLTK